MHALNPSFAGRTGLTHSTSRFDTPAARLTWGRLSRELTNSSLTLCPSFTKQLRIQVEASESIGILTLLTSKPFQDVTQGLGLRHQQARGRRGSKKKPWNSSAKAHFFPPRPGMRTLKGAVPARPVCRESSKIHLTAGPGERRVKDSSFTARCLPCSTHQLA